MAACTEDRMVLEGEITNTSLGEAGIQEPLVLPDTSLRSVVPYGFTAGHQLADALSVSVNDSV